MDKIDKISLDCVVPNVFAGEPISSEVWNCRLTLDRGSAYRIDAASGTGKTTLCSFLFGVRRDFAGTILFNGRDTGQFSVSDWCETRRRHIAYLPQELDVFDELSALDNVLLKNRLTDFRSAEEIRTMFERLEIDNRIDTPCGRMSVGQRQRVALIRALCQPFDFILLDEPVSHLDGQNNSLCADMVAEEARRQQSGVIFTSVGNPLNYPDPFVPLKL